MAEEPIDVQFFQSVLDPAAAVRRVTVADAGGIDVFVGTTRAENHAELGALVHLDYHAYAEMALVQMRKLAESAMGQWPAARIALWHRLGAVRVGEASVVIAVSCSHRADAFSACRFLIDSLKQTVPIWKREVYEKSARWQGE